MGKSSRLLKEYIKKVSVKKFNLNKLYINNLIKLFEEKIQFKKTKEKYLLIFTILLYWEVSPYTPDFAKANRLYLGPIIKSISE